MNRSIPVAALLVSVGLLTTPPTARGGGGGGDTFSECGELVFIHGSPSCLVFRGDSGATVALQDYGEFAAGDRVFVSGVFLVPSLLLCGGEAVPVLSNATIEPCYARCGTLQQDPAGCLYFEGDDGQQFVLQNTESFGAGAQVFVNGVVQPVGTPCPASPLITSQLIDNAIGPCLEAVGRLAADAEECLQLRTPDGAAYSLELYGGFEAGDFVFVRGALETGCSDVCGAPCVQSNTVERQLASCGVLVADPDCGVVLHADFSELGFVFRVDELGPFNVGDRVYVTGRIDEENCFSTGFCHTPCLTDTTIAACVSGCGTIEFAASGCLVFDPEDGGPAHLLEFRDGFVPGDSIYVSGAAGPEAECLPATFPIILQNTIDPCFSGCGVLLQAFECPATLATDDGQSFTLQDYGDFQVEQRVRVSGAIRESTSFFCQVSHLAPNTIDFCAGIAAANPPAESPYLGAGHPFRDVLQTGMTASLTQGIGGAGTPPAGDVTYDQILIAFTEPPESTPEVENVHVECTDVAGNGSSDCPSVTSVAITGVGPIVVTLSSVIPPRECVTLTIDGVAGQLQYQSLPGDASLDGLTNTQDLLALVQALNNGSANVAANLARYNINRSGGANPVNTQDLLRLIQLLNGVLTTQAFNGASVASCP